MPTQRSANSFLFAAFITSVIGVSPALANPAAQARLLALVPASWKAIVPAPGQVPPVFAGQGASGMLTVSAEKPNTTYPRATAANSQANLSIAVNVHDPADPIGRYALDALRSLSLPQAYQSAAREGWQPPGQESGILFHPVVEANTGQGRAWCQEQEVPVATDSGKHIEHYTNCKHVGLTSNTHYVIEITNAPGKRHEVDRIAAEIFGKIRGLGFAQLVGQ